MSLDANVGQNGIKQVEENPWIKYQNKYSAGDKYNGKVIKILDKGLIIELENDLEGIIYLNVRASL